jgi:RNA polymerase primary sigma factor
MEMNMGKFSEKLVELLELAKKKKNVLEYQEINDFFKDQPLGVEQMEKVFDFLEASGVDVLRITDGNADDMMQTSINWMRKRLSLIRSIFLFRKV